MKNPYASILKRLDDGEQMDPATAIGDAGGAVRHAHKVVVNNAEAESPAARERRRTSDIPSRRDT